MRIHHFRARRDLPKLRLEQPELRPTTTEIPMSDYNQEQLTQDVLAAFDTTPDPRLRQLMMALVKHIHAFAREVDLTPEEWMAGLNFLTPPGRSRPSGGPSSSCCPTRWACR
jgi:hypothetical protein